MNIQAKHLMEYLNDWAKFQQMFYNTAEEKLEWSDARSRKAKLFNLKKMSLREEVFEDLWRWDRVNIK